MPDERAGGPRHAVLGAGGVGGFLAALLGHAGDHVTLLLREGAFAAHPDRLSLESPYGRIVTRPHRATRLMDEADVLWVTVKATQLEGALGAVPDPGRVRTVVPLLNGIDHVAFLRSRFGPDRVVPATIAIECERTAPGIIVHRSPFAGLAFSAAGRDRLDGVAATLARAGCTCSFVEDEASLLWRKLVFLAPLALTTTAAGMALGEALSSAGWRLRLQALVAEACAVARAVGADVDPGETLRRLRALPPAIRSSMQKDVAAGRPPELDAIGGPILRGGERHGVPVPVTAELVAGIRARFPAAP